MIRIVLASNSPRRKEILKNLGLKFQVVSPDVDERTQQNSANAAVEELSLQKAKAVHKQLKEQGESLENTLIIAADTVVVHGLKMLGKPKTPADAKKMLQRLMGDTHFVMTGVTLLYNGRITCQSELTKIHFTNIPEQEIDLYVKSGEPMDKAGSYGIQGLASLWIDRIDGDYFNVVGFPVHRFYTMLNGLGLSFEELEKE